MQMKIQMRQIHEVIQGLNSNFRIKIKTWHNFWGWLRRCINREVGGQADGQNQISRNGSQTYSKLHSEFEQMVEVFRMVQLSNAYIDGLVRDCSNPNALAMELLQSCTKPSIWCTSGRWANQLRSPEQIGRGNCGENIFKWIFLTRNSGGEYQLVRSWWYIKLRSGTRLDRAATDFLVHF